MTRMAPRFEPRENMEDLEASFLDKKKKESTKWKDGVFYYTLCSAYALAFCIALVLSFSLSFNFFYIYIVYNFPLVLMRFYFLQ